MFALTAVIHIISYGANVYFAYRTAVHIVIVTFITENYMHGYEAARSQFAHDIFVMNFLDVVHLVVGKVFVSHYFIHLIR